MGACTSLAQPRHGKNQPPGSTKEHRSGLTKVVYSKNPRIHKAYDVDSKKLGEGGCGAVHRATQRASGRERAVKCMSSQSPHQALHCRREISIMGSADHPNIAKLMETFQDGKYTYLVMELCRGGDLLSRMVACGGSLSEEYAAMVLQQIFRGTLYLHQCSIAHRDLKPGNLLFANDGPVRGNTLKIIDFGLARKFAAGEMLATKVGTPSFVAPEVLAGTGYDEQCDTWSIGVTAHVLLCGYPPFTGGSDQSVLKKVSRGRFSFVPRHWAPVSPNARALVSKLLCKDPQRRPTASLALSDDWLRCWADAERGTIPCGLVESLRRFRSADVLSRAARHVLAGLLDDVEARAARGAFLALDRDGDGRVSQAELREGLGRSGFELSEQELLEIFEGVDADGNGTIEYTEFLAATVDRSTRLKEGMCQDAFDVFDWNGDGRISRKDLMHVLRNCRLSEAVGAEIQDIVDALEHNEGGSLSFTEFTDKLSS